MDLNRQNLLVSGLAAFSSMALPRLGFAEPSAEEAFSYSFDEIKDHLAVINTVAAGRKQRYGGFIALFDDKPYLITNQHYILGSDRITFNSPSGRSIKPRSIELAADCDLVRMQLAEGSGFTLAAKPAMGQSIGIFGSNSTDSKNAVFGTINGVGADIIEVSAEFDDTNGGCPLLDPDKHVLGIASYSRESSNHIMKKGTRFENRTRRFCLRVDNVQWKAVNWKKFNQSFGRAYLESSVMIDDMITILNSWADGPLDSVEFENTPNKKINSWLQAHNRIVSRSVDTGNGRREFYSNYSESAEKLATFCEIQARKVRALLDQRGLTEFMANELDMQASTLEMAADVINRYGASTY